MKKEEYINLVIDRINNNRARAKVKRELEDHIDDRIEYYTDAGYDYEYASKAAIEKMGKPENVAAEMDKLYSSTADVILKIILVTYYSICIFLFPFGYLALMTMFSKLDWYSTFRELFMIVSVMASLAIARNRYWHTLAWLQPYYILYCAITSMGLGIFVGDFASPSVLFLNCLLSGKMGDYNQIMGSYCEYTTSTVFKTESLIFYLALILFSVANAVFIKRTVDKGVSGRTKRKKAAFFAVSLLFVVIPSGAFAFAGQLDSYNAYDTYDEIIIYESDSKCNVDSIPDDDTTFLFVNYDWSPYPDIEVYGNVDSPHIANDEDSVIVADNYECNVESIRFNNLVSYDRQTTSFKYIAKHKYIKVVMEDDYGNEKESEWLKAEGLTYEDTIQRSVLKSDCIRFEVISQ